MPRGGKRANAGAPKGTIQRRSLEKSAVARALRERTMAHADNLFNAQLTKAVGSVMVFRVDEEGIGNGKTKRVHTHITDPDEIKKVLDKNEGGAGIIGKDYYFVTNIAPDNRAIDSMLDRTFGKAMQPIEVSENSDELTQLKNQIEKVAESEGTDYKTELDIFLREYADKIKPDLKIQLASELTQ